MDLSSSSLSDTSSEDSSYTGRAPPTPNPLLSLYRRELTDRRDEISQLKQQLGGMREKNLRLERALDMKSLNSYELDRELQETLDKLESRDKKGMRERQLQVDRGRRHSERGGYFFTDAYSYLDKYVKQPPPVRKSTAAKKDQQASRLPTPGAATERELVKPLTYQKSSNASVRWIKHAPNKTSYDGIFQPQKTRGKEVTQPRKEDLIGKKHPRDKYVLSHQEATPDGAHLVTTLYKGNVNPTRSGGAQVRFTDTEVLHQCRTDLAHAHHIPPLRQIIEPLNRLRMATVEDAMKVPDPYAAQPSDTGATMDEYHNKVKSDAKFRIATLKDAKQTPKHNPASHLDFRRATIEDAMLPTQSRYFYMV